MKSRVRRRGGNGSASPESAFLLLISLLVLPFTGSLILNLSLLFSEYRRFTPEMLATSAGFAVCFVWLAFSGPPARSYVLEHELSHVLFSFLSGVRVKKIHVGREGGSVSTSRVNMVIALAPYAFPLYSLCVVVAHLLLRQFVPGGGAGAVITHIMHGAFGFTLAFHILATLHYVRTDQPDLKRYGYFSSIVFIFTLTIVVCALMIGLVFAKTRLFAYFGSSILQAGRLYGFLFRRIARR